jgi:2,4-dienoyl-CoA reductase-like NADH-dependent reductase (Old Yellow Enzyme family)
MPSANPTRHYTTLFSPISLREKSLRNRIVFRAHTSNMSQDGVPGAQHVAYYRERAMGGAAMLVVEPMPAHAAAVLTRGNFRHSSDEVIPYFRNVTEAVRAEGAPICQQLYHVGQHDDADNSYHTSWSPSGQPSYHDSDGSHAMSEAEIEETIEGFIQVARRCKEAGFDGVEVWAAYHGLVDQFWTPWSNRRNDKWGGSLENRTSFSRAILTRIRNVCGDDFIIGLAVSDDRECNIALSREKTAEIIEPLIDYVTCRSGSYLNFQKIISTFLYPEKLGADLAMTVKSIVKHALVTAESHIRTPDNAEDVLTSGAADQISIVRRQIADPHLANKAREGRPEDIRGCLPCNQMCWGRRYRDYWISCLVNPSVGREREWGGDRFEPASKRRRVLAVGGRHAGLEAARVAAERGHRVTLAEAASKLGARFRLAGLQPQRAQILDLIDWYELQLGKLRVVVQRNSFMDSEEVLAFGAAGVVVATGALRRADGFQRVLPHLEPLPGSERGNVWSAEDVMAGSARLGERVVLLDEGGNWRGCGTAWKVAEQGKKVFLITADPMIGKELQRTAADFPLRHRLAQLDVEFICETGVLEGTGGCLISLLSGKEQMIEFDSLVFASVGVAQDAMARELEDKGLQAPVIGDAAASGQTSYAIYDGRRLGLSYDA